MAASLLGREPGSKGTSTLGRSYGRAVKTVTRNSNLSVIVIGEL
jgi:hypothetical protein